MSESHACKKFALCGSFDPPTVDDISKPELCCNCGVDLCREPKPGIDGCLYYLAKEPATVDVTITVPVPPDGYDPDPATFEFRKMVFGEMFCEHGNPCRWITWPSHSKSGLCYFIARKLTPPEPVGLEWLETLTPGTTFRRNEVGHSLPYSWTGKIVQYLRYGAGWTEIFHDESVFSASTCTIIGDPSKVEGE